MNKKNSHLNFCCLVVSVSALMQYVHGFMPRLGHSKDFHKNATNCLPAWHAYIKVGV